MLLSKKDKVLRGKVEFIVILFYIISLVLFVITKRPACVMLTGLSVPFCMSSKIKTFLLS